MTKQHLYNRTYIVILLSFSFIFQIYGQTDSSLPLATKYEDGHIKLRWMPNTIKEYKAFNEKGYKITRFELSSKDKLTASKIITLNDKPIKSVSGFLQTPDSPVDDYALLAVEVLKEENEYPKNFSLENFSNQQYDKDMKNLLLTLATSFSFTAAEVFGLAYKDKNVEPNKSYAYRIETIENKKLGRVSSSVAYIQTNNNFEFPKVVNVETTGEANIIKIEWSVSPNEEYFFAYDIEASKNETGPFLKINNAPIYQQLENKEGNRNTKYFYRDTIGTQNISKYYRVRGYDIFGQISRPSDIVKGKTLDLEPPFVPFEIEVDYEKDKGVIISWDNSTQSPDMKGYMVERSNFSTGPFVSILGKLLDKNVNEYIDKNPVDDKINYYRIVAYDEVGNFKASSSKHALIPLLNPQKPTGLHGTIDTNGIVRLEWDSNDTIDLIGYQVFFSNSTEHSFLQVANSYLEEPRFTDTISLETLTTHAFYLVQAVNRIYGRSPFSDTLVLRRPDKIPPSPPHFISSEIVQNEISLKWENSKSPDAITQTLYLQNSEMDWDEIETFSIDVEEYAYAYKRDQKEFVFCIVSNDNSGLSSIKSTPIVVNQSAYSDVSTVGNLKLVFDESQKQLKLSWQYQNDDVRFIIYKGNSKNSLKSVQSIINEDYYIDSSPTKGSYYAIRVAHGSFLSGLSEIKVYE